MQGINFHEFRYVNNTLIIANKFASTTKNFHLVEQKTDHLEHFGTKIKQTKTLLRRVQQSRTNSSPKGKIHGILGGINRSNFASIFEMELG